MEEDNNNKEDNDIKEEEEARRAKRRPEGPKEARRASYYKLGPGGPLNFYIKYFSQTPHTASVEKKLVMWRNSPHDLLSSGKFLHIIDVETILSSGG